MPVLELGNAKVTDLRASIATQKHIGGLQVPAVSTFSLEGLSRLHSWQSLPLHVSSSSRGCHNMLKDLCSLPQGAITCGGSVGRSDDAGISAHPPHLGPLAAAANGKHTHALNLSETCTKEVQNVQPPST